MRGARLTASRSKQSLCTLVSRFPSQSLWHITRLWWQTGEIREIVNTRSILYSTHLVYLALSGQNKVDWQNINAVDLQLLTRCPGQQGWRLGPCCLQCQHQSCQLTFAKYYVTWRFGQQKSLKAPISYGLWGQASQYTVETSVQCFAYCL